MVARAVVIAQARTWIGTRWHHLGRVKGERGGCDCAGLVIGVARELGICDVHTGNYSRYPDGTLEKMCGEHMEKINPSAALPGDVLTLTFDKEPQHLAFLSDLSGAPGLIHGFADAKRVVEHNIDALWRSRIRGAYHLPGVE